MNSVPVSVMDIRVVGMRVAEGAVVVLVGMRLAPVPGESMCMLVM